MTDKTSLVDSSARVLVLSEDDAVLRMAETELRQRYTVTTANSADNAIRLLAEQGPFAAVLTDRVGAPTGIDSLLPELVGRYPETALMIFDGVLTLSASKDLTIH
jgi:DNA-binding NtrC family response regulator